MPVKKVNTLSKCNRSRSKPSSHTGEARMRVIKKIPLKQPKYGTGNLVRFVNLRIASNYAAYLLEA